MASGWSNGTVQIQVIRHSNITVMTFHTSKLSSNSIIVLSQGYCMHESNQIKTYVTYDYLR